MKYIAQRICLLSLLLLFNANFAFGTVFTATTSGDWSSSATWGGTAPGLSVDSTHEVVIPAGITVTLDQDVETRALLTINGGTLAVGDHELTIAGDYVTTLGGSLDVTSNSELSLRGDAKSSPIQFTKASDTLSNLYVNTGDSHFFTYETIFNSDLHIMDTLYLKRGYLNFHDQTIGMYGDILLGDSIKIEGNEATDILLKTSGNITEAPNTFEGRFYFNKADTFWVEMTGQDSVELDYTARVYGDLFLQEGRVILGEKQFVMEQGSEIHGGSPTSYIQTNGTNDLRVKAMASDSIFYPIGTSSGYKPASLKINDSTNGNYGVRVMDHVYKDGLSGNLISDSSDVVDQTWDVNTYGISGNVDVNFSAYWSAQDEMNQFDHDSCFISHYSIGWDHGTYTEASTTANGMFTLTRDSIANLSPFTVFSESTNKFFIAQSSGKWSNSSNWTGGTSPGGAMSSGKQVVIPSGISIELDQDIEIAGSSSSLQVSGNLFNDAQEVTIIEGTLAGSGTVDIHTLNLQSNAVLAFTGDLTVNNLYSKNMLIELAGTATVEDTLSCEEVSLQIKAGNQLTLNDGIAFILNNASISNHSISIGGNGAADLIYKGDGKVTTGEFNIGTINNLTIDFNDPSERLIQSKGIAVVGMLNVNNGILDIDNKFVSIQGDLTMASNGNFMAEETANLMIQSDNSLSSAVKFTGGADTLGGIMIDIGAGNEVEFDSDVRTEIGLSLTSGTLNIQEQQLTLAGSITAEPNAELSTNAQTTFWIAASGNVEGALNFNPNNNTVGDLLISLASSDSIAFGSDAKVDGTLTLDIGNIAIGDNDLMLTANANVQGGSPDSYVRTSGEGKLGMSLAAGDTAAYHVGTAEGYAKAWLKLNSGSSDGNYMVNVQNDVWAQGSNGTDISASESVVDHTWDITTDAPGSVDVNVALTWEGAAEVNSFDNQNCYIAHYTGGSWDATATASATANANGTFTITRDNVTSLSPFAVFDENTSVGIEEQVKASNHIDLYPNPAQEVLHIESKLDEATVIEIYTVNGQLVKQEDLSRGHNQIDLNGLNEGTYYIHLVGLNAGMSFIKQ